VGFNFLVRNLVLKARIVEEQKLYISLFSLAAIFTVTPTKLTMWIPLNILFLVCYTQNHCRTKLKPKINFCMPN